MDYENLGIDSGANQQPGGLFSQLTPVRPEGPTAFQRGFVNFADQQTQFAPAFTRSRDMMMLDADPYGERTQRWAQANGMSYDSSYVAGLNVFGRAMSREQLEQSEAGRDLLRIATDNRLGKRRGFWEALTDFSWGDLPFVGIVASVAGSATGAFQVHETMKKLQDGAPVTDDELIKTRLYLAKQEWDSAGTWGATVGDIVRQAPGFVTEFVFSGGIGTAARVAGAKAAVKGAEKIGSRAVSLAVGRGIKRMTKELAEEGLEKMATNSVGASLSSSEFRKGVAAFLSNLTGAQKAQFADDLATSITPLLKKDLQRTFGGRAFGGRASYMYTDEVVDQMAKNLARSQLERSVARMGASDAFRRFGHGLVDFMKEHFAAGLLDFGTFGTPTSTVLFGAHNRAGQALKDALGVLLVEAPVKGALQFGVSSLVREGVMLGAAGGNYVSEAQLNLESQALRTGNRQLMESAGAIALGVNFLEYASENSGRGFSDLFRSAGLATGLAKQATRMYEGKVGGILAEAKVAEAGGMLQKLVRRAVGSWEETARRTADARTVSVLNYLRRNRFDVDRAAAARIASGDAAHITDEAARRFIGGDVEKFVVRAIKDEAGRRGSDMSYKSYLRYWAADKMVKHHLGPDELANAFQRMGYDGIVEEMMEERYSDFAKGLFGWDEKGHAMMSPDAIKQALRNITPGTDELPWDQLAAEAVGFAIPLLTKSAAMRVMRAVGGPSMVGEVRDVAGAAARAASAMTAVERTTGDFRRDHEATMGRLDEERKSAETGLLEADRQARARGLVGSEALAATEAARARVKSVAARIKAQDDAYRRILAANGLSVESIAEEAADRLMFVPVVSTREEAGDLAGDKLRVDRSSEQLQDAYGSQGAAISNAWKIGKAEFDSMDREHDSTEGWWGRLARKTVGIAAAIVTGDPSLAMHDYARWAAVDEGLDPLVASLLHSQYREDRQDALAKIRAERAEALKSAGEDAGAGASTGSFAVSEEEIWERMAPRYKANAAAVMSSYLAMKNVHMFSQSDIRGKAVDYLATRAGYAYRDGVYEKTGDDGSVSRLTAEEYAAANAADVDGLAADISAAVVRILADKTDVDLGAGSIVSLFQLPADAPQRERTALAIATKLSGFGNLFTNVRIGRGQTVEDAAEVFGMSVRSDVLDRIRQVAVKPDGTVDYNAPDEKDILEVAASLRRGAVTGSDEELQRLRRGVVDVARQAAAMDDGRVLSYSAPVPEAVYMKNRRLYGSPYVGLEARRRSDGQWVVTVDTSATSDGGSEGKIDIVKATPEEMDAALAEYGYKRRERGVVITPTMVLSTSDPIQLAQQLGIMTEYERRTSGKVTEAGTVDPRYVHPLLRKDENGDYANSPEQAEAVLHEQMLRAWMYDRYGDDPTKYPVGAADVDAALEADPEYTKHRSNLQKIEARLRKDAYATSGERLLDEADEALARTAVEERRRAAEAQARRRVANEARIAHDALYGENGYMKILNDMLRERKVTVPGDGGIAGMLTGNSVYSVGLNHVRAVAGSAKHYVAVNFEDGQSDSGAILNAVLEDAFARHRRLVSGRGRFTPVVGDFLKYLYTRAEALIYGDRVTNREREALIRFRDDILAQWQNPTSRAFSEVAGAFALFAAEKDKSEGSSGFTRHSLACQVLSTNELYGSPQFLRFFALTDMMLGGSAFSYEIAARRLKAGDVSRNGIARIMDLFGTDTEPLRKMVAEIKPLGKTYAQFTEEVNRQAQTLNPRPARPQQGQAPGAKASPPANAAGILEFIRNSLGNAHFDNAADVEAAFNAMAAEADTGLRNAFKARAAEFKGIEQRLSAELDRQSARLKELEAEKRAAEEGRDTVVKDRNELREKVAELQEKIDGVVMALDDVRRAGGRVAVQSAEGGGDTPAIVKAGRELQAKLDRLAPPPIPVDPSDFLDSDAASLLGEDDPAFRLVLGDNVDTATAASIDFDDNGNPVVVDHDSASADLPREACEFGASAFRSMFESLSGTTDPVGYEEFARQLDRLGTFRDAEKRRLYGFYKNQAVRAEAMRVAAEFEDDEGVKSTNDQNFNDRLLREYEGEELDAFLTLGSFVAPEEGRSLQGVLDSIRGVVVRRLSSERPGSALHESLSRIERILNPRAVTAIHTKEYDELTRRIEELRRSGADPSEAEKLRVQRAQMFTNVDRETEWRRAVAELSAPGRDSGATVFDQTIADLMSGDEPASGRAAFLLSFLKSLGPAKQVRLLSLCANSAVCSRAEVDLETRKLRTIVGQKNSLFSRAVSAAFAPLRRLSKEGARKMADDVRAAVTSTRFDYDVPADLTSETGAMRNNFNRLADALVGYLGEENPLVCILRSDSLLRYIRSSRVFGGEGADSVYDALRRRIVPRSSDNKTAPDKVPEFARGILNLLDEWAHVRARTGLGDAASPEAVEDALDRVVSAWFAYGVGAAESASIGHKTAMNSTIWKRIFETYAASRPVTVAPSVYIPGRSVSTSSKVVVAAPGVVPAVAQWMDRPISDKTSFAYIAKNFMLGATGDALRRMSDADFLENVYPECRQTMTWPDAQHTPVLAKNLTRDFTPDYMFDRCEELFDSRFGGDDAAYGVAASGAATYKNLKGETKLAVVRWYSPVFAGEHTSGVLLQLPGLAYERRDPNTGETSIATFVDRGESFEHVSTRLNMMMGLAKLGDDAKRAALTTAQVPAVALRGSKMENGRIVYGENRVHALVTLDPDLAFANQETMKGLIVGVGYGIEEQRKVASDPESDILKLHYMSTSGAELEMFKGLTVAAREKDGRASGLYARGTVVRALQEHLLGFRKGDADISTSVMTDRDGMKVCVLNSKVVGVPYVGADGKPARMKLLDYMISKLRGVDIPEGGLDVAALDAVVGDGKAAPEGADPADYRPGTFAWSYIDEDGRRVEARKTLSDLLGGESGLSGVKVAAVKGLHGAAMDVSYVDNGLMSYTVANVSHEAEPETGRAARNTMVDAATMAAVQVRGGMATGHSAESARRIRDNFANWGLLVAAVGADPRLVDDSRFGAGRSSKVEELIDGKGDDPHSLLVDNQLAYDVMKRLRSSLNLPLNQVACALVSGGAMYDDRNRTVQSLSDDPFVRYSARGSRVFSKSDRRDKYNGIARSFGWGQINVRSDGFRYAWHLDRAKFAENFGERYRSASSDELRVALDTVFTDLRSVDDVRAEAHRAYLTAALARAADEPARKEAFLKATEDSRKARLRIAECFVDHYGRRVSEMKVQFEQKKIAEKASGQSSNYRDSVSFDDLFLANPNADGPARIFDRSAVHGGDAALRLDKDAAARAGAAHMAEDADPVLLAGTAFGLPRTPSYNGSMWLQVLRASIPASTVEDEDGNVVMCGRDAAVIPDAQSLQILGCDHDGDKSSCYLLKTNTRTGRAETQDIPDASDPLADDETGSLAAVLGGFARRPEVRRKYLDRMVAAGLVSAPSAGKTKDGRSLNTYRIAEGAFARVSNSFVMGMFDLARNTVQESPDEETDFYGTHLARATRFQPVNGSKDDRGSSWGRLVEIAGDAAKYLTGTTLANSRAAAHVSTSAMSADRARGQIVSHAGTLHFALMSGKYDATFFRGDVADRVNAWFDFIYGLDGISNATFDDIKEQICRRLGWTSGMIDTVVADLMFSGDRIPTTEDEFYDILADYVGEIANHGSRYYMMAAAEPPEGNDEFTDVHVDARKFALGEKYKDGGDRRIAYDTPVTMNSVLERFHIRESRNAVGTTVFRLAPDCRSAEGLAAVKDPMVRAVLSPIVASRAGLDGAAAATDAEKEMCEAVVRSLSFRRGESAGLGYVFYLAKTAGDGGVSRAAMERFLRWHRGTTALSRMREFVAAANYTKADPGDPGKMGRRGTMNREFEKVMEASPAGEGDAALHTMNTAVRTIYGAGLMPIAGRARLAAASRGEALVALNKSFGKGHVRDVVRTMIGKLACMPAVSTVDDQRLQANVLSDPFFVAALRTVPAARAGTSLFGDRQYTWAVFDAIAEAVQDAYKSDDADVRELPKSMALRSGLESIISVMYSLVSASAQGVDCPAFGFMSLNYDRSYGGSFVRTGVSREDGSEVRTVEEKYPGAGKGRIRRLRPAFVMKDDAGLQRARKYMQRVMDGALDKGGAFGARTALYTNAHVRAKDFSLSIGNLSAFADETRPAEPGQRETDVETDIRVVQAIINRIATSVLKVDPGQVSIQPSTVVTQLIPVYTTMTEKFGSDNSVVELIPGLRQRLTAEQARMFSGALDNGADIGLGFWDILAATAHAPASRLYGGYALATPVAGRLDEARLSSVLRVLDYADAGAGNTVFENGLASDVAAVSGGEPSGASHAAPKNRVMLDVLGPFDLFRTVHAYVDDMMLAGAATPADEVTPESATAAMAEVAADTTVTAPDPSARTDAERLVPVLVSLVGKWADVEHVRGTDVVKIRARGGLRGLGASRFANGGRTDMVITIRLGSDSRAGGLAVDVNSPAVAASFCQAAPKLGLAPEQFLTMLSHREREMLVRSLTSGTSAQQEGGAFTLSLPSWAMTGRDIATLAGEIHLGANASAGTLYHELFHAMIGMFRVMDVFDERDVEVFRKRYGDAPKGTGWLFNEEKAAEEFRKYAERRARGETVAVRDEADQKAHSVFRKLWEALKSFLNALAGGFSHADPHSVSYLFDMVLTGTAALSDEKKQSIGVEKLADNAVFAGTFERLLERSRDDRGAFAPEYGVDAAALESLAAGRVASALSTRRSDPFAGFIDQAASTDTAKVPKVSGRGRLAQAAKWSKALEAELMNPRPRVSALAGILRNLVAVRGEGTESDAFEVPFDPSADSVSWKTVVNMDSGLSPETRAAMYAPEGVMGRAAARALIGEITPDDAAIIAGAAEGKSFVDQLASNVRYQQAAARGSRWAEDYKARMLRQDITAKLGVKHFLRAEGHGDPASDEELKRANDAYMLLVAATPHIRSFLRAANRQKADIVTSDGAVVPRDDRRLTAENYAGFLMATGWHDARDYIANARARLQEIRRNASDVGEPDQNRIARTADHLLRNLAEFEALDSASMVSDPKRWEGVINKFMGEVTTGIKRGDLDLATGEYGLYSNTGEADPEPAGEKSGKDVKTLRLRNQGIYGLGTGTPEGDRIVDQMIRDTVTTVLGVRASARFARAIGTAPGTFADMPAAAANPPQVGLEKLAEQFRLSTGNIVEGDEDLIDVHCQPAFVTANLDSWYAASLPAAVGNMPLRKVFMEASAKLRGCISAQTLVENFLASYMGIARTEGNKLLRIVERKGKFEMGSGFWHRVEEGKEPTYIGFDNYHGLNGDTVPVELTEDEYRMVDLFLKSLAVRANGGTKYITGAAGIRFDNRSTAIPVGWTAAESVKALMSTESDRSPVKALSAHKLALARLGLQVQDEVLSVRGFFDEAVTAINEGLAVARSEERRVMKGDDEHPPRAFTDAEFNNAVLAEMERRGVVVCEYDDSGMRVSGAFAIDTGRIESNFRASSAFSKLVNEAGRDAEFMRGSNLIKLYMKGYHDLRREVAKHPWLTSGDARFLNNFATPLPFYQGTGNFMYHANRLVRDRALSASVRLAKHEATFLGMCSSTSSKVKTAVDLSSAQLNMLRDYFGLEEADNDALLKAIATGEYAAGSEKSSRTGFAADASTPYLDVARQIYVKVQERQLLRAEGRSVSEIDDDASILRMMQAYESMTDAGGTTLSGAAGISDERMFQLHGVLPMSMQIGHKIHTAMRGIQDALYKRSCLVNMMFTKTAEGAPAFYINPSRFGVEAGGIPDEVWGAMAKWWASRHPRSLKYNQGLSGVENARAMYGVVSSLLQNGKTLDGRTYESMKQEDLLGQRSVENILCVKDAPDDSDTSALNVAGGVGEALGYAKHLFMVDRVPGAAKLQWMDKVMAWAKSLNVMYTAFFPIATKWESTTAAVGGLATLGSNLSPEFLRRHHDAANALQKLFGGTGWIDENFVGFRDVVEMMDTNDPFLADLVRWAEALGITMSNTVRNPMEPGKGYVAKDIAELKDRMRSWGWSAKAASRFGGVLETLFLRSGEKAFTYALNATKLAVTCQIAMKLRHQAELEGRAFDPIRDLSKYAAYIDTEIGGIDPLRYAWAHPQMQRIMNRVLFSWQWTRSAWEAGGGHFFEDLLFGGHTINKETRKYIVGRWLRMYGIVMVGVPMMAQILVKALAKACGRDDDDDKWFTWENEDKTKWSAFNLTPLMKVVHDHEFTARVVGGGVGALYGAMRGRGFGAAVGAVVGAAGVPNYTGRDAANATTRGRKYYMHFGKQGWEFFRWFDKPVEQFFAKLSMPTQRLLEGVFGRNLAYLDRELPFADKGLAERWLSLGADSAPVNMLKAFLPFTVNGVTTFGDAGVASYFGPVQMGASQTNIVDRYVKALKAWADNDRRGYAFGSEASKKRVKAVRRERLADITRDAVMNGIRNPEELIERAVGQLAPRYYGRLVNLLPESPDDPVDAKEIAKTCRALLRLGATYKGALQSLEKRMKTRGVEFRKLPAETRARVVGSLREGFKDPFGTDDGFGYRPPMSYDY